MKRCFVPGCEDSTSRRFYFPAEKRVRDIWIQRIGNTHLLDVDEKNLRKSYTICENHFSDLCKDQNGRLLRYSLPTLNLPQFQETPAEDNCFSRPSQQRQYATPVTPEKLQDALSSLPSTLASSPGTVLFTAPPQKVYAPCHATRRRALFGVDSSISSTNIAECELHEIVSMQTSIEPCPSTSWKITHLQENVSLQPKNTKRKTGVRLSAVGIIRQKDLSPKAKIFYKQTKYLQQVATKLKRKEFSVRRKLKFVQSKPNIVTMFQGVNDVTANFCLSQLRNQKYKPRGRRFTVDDKILALSLYKQSGRGYRYLSRIFSLPSKKGLTEILNKVPFYSGINKSIFAHLKTRVSKMKAIDKHCVLMFDEIALSPGLEYNKRTDSVEGFVDSGGPNRRLAFADHALTFITKGIYRKWKQTVCFSFCEGTTPTMELRNILKEVIRQLRDCGFNVVATISDQGATNQGAINQLISETNSSTQNMENTLQGYLIDDAEIVHLYDFPHLIKCVRNMLLYKDLYFVQDGVQKVASWSHIMRLYELDKCRGAYSQFLKLTDEHIIPAKIKKMRVINCTQVFSHTVGTAMHVAARVSRELSVESEFYLDPKAKDTADLLLFFDKLFDSVNGSSIFPPPGKALRTVVTRKPEHISFWVSCLPVIQSMYFTQPNCKTRVRPPLPQKLDIFT